MGLVYLARDPQIEREVALKTVRCDGPGSTFNVDESKARFLKEPRISGRLQPPHIVTVFDVGEDQGTLYLAMEYVSGGSLSQRLGKGEPLELEDRIRIVGEVASALAHAHERGVIHRDIKPANILLTETLRAKVTDFGIGKLLAGDTDLTSTGQMVGSPSYMSPEQIRGEKLDVRSDIFSLGVVLYQTITERKPFPADTLTTPSGERPLVSPPPQSTPLAATQVGAARSGPRGRLVPAILGAVVVAIGLGVWATTAARKREKPAPTPVARVEPTVAPTPPEAIVPSPPPAGSPAQPVP